MEMSYSASSLSFITLSILSLAYLSCLRSVFRYNGYTKGLDEIRPLFDKNMPEGALKDEINGLYKSYEHLKQGNVAPAFTLKDFRGKEHSLSDSGFHL